MDSRGTVCTLGWPCTVQLSGAGFSSTNRLRVLHSSSNCGDGVSASVQFSPSGRFDPEPRVLQEAPYDTYHFQTETAGPHGTFRLCWGSRPVGNTEWSVDVGSFTMAGPSTKNHECTLGMHCNITAPSTGGDEWNALQLQERMHGCDSPSFGYISMDLAVEGLEVAVYVSGSTSGTFSLGTPIAGQVGSIATLCWGHAPASLHEGTQFFFGLLTMSGPEPGSTICTLGAACHVELTGAGLAFTNQIRIIESSNVCGNATAATDLTGFKSDSSIFDGDLPAKDSVKCYEPVCGKNKVCVGFEPDGKVYCYGSNTNCLFNSNDCQTDADCRAKYTRADDKFTNGRTGCPLPLSDWGSDACRCQGTIYFQIKSGNCGPLGDHITYADECEVAAAELAVFSRFQGGEDGGGNATVNSTSDETRPKGCVQQGNKLVVFPDAIGDCTYWGTGSPPFSCLCKHEARHFFSPTFGETPYNATSNVVVNSDGYYGFDGATTFRQVEHIAHTDLTIMVIFRTDTRPPACGKNFWDSAMTLVDGEQARNEATQANFSLTLCDAGINAGMGLDTLHYGRIRALEFAGTEVRLFQSSFLHELYKCWYQ